MTVANAESTANGLLAQVDAYRFDASRYDDVPAGRLSAPTITPQRKELAMKITPSSGSRTAVAGRPCVSCSGK